jgi:hypothetical protein
MTLPLAGTVAWGGLVMVGEMLVERSAQRILLLLYLDWRGRPRVRIHGRPRSDRKRRFLLSAVALARAPGTHAKQGPSTGRSAVGLRQGEKRLLTPRPHFTASSCTLGNQVVVLRTALLFVRSAVRLVYAELPGPVAVCLSKRALCELGDYSDVLRLRCLTTSQCRRTPARCRPRT